eukprot:GHVU01190235.1.p1 GENE.GHVU01190235.1~~GHVU01190235.1.p1  ORF type:complete len:362 (+),score=85.60 GHVU01190235.1:673-1758(+)
MGLADGVGEWINYGLNPRQFADELMLGAMDAACDTFHGAVPRAGIFMQSSAADASSKQRRRRAGGCRHYGGGATSSAAASAKGADDGHDDDDSHRPPSSPPPGGVRSHIIIPQQQQQHSGGGGDGSCGAIAAKARVVMQRGFDATTSYGSATALLALVDGRSGRMGVCNLGDSGLIVLRRVGLGKMQIVFRTREQQHSFNCPFQLMRIPDHRSPPELAKLSVMGLHRLARVLSRCTATRFDAPSSDAQLSGARLREGDLLLAATDGFFDNFFAEETAALCAAATSPLEAIASNDSAVATDPADLAAALAGAARARSLHPRAPTPFSANASAAGRLHTGGKLDDVTVACAWVVRRREATATG